LAPALFGSHPGNGPFAHYVALELRDCSGHRVKASWLAAVPVVDVVVSEPARRRALRNISAQQYREIS